MSNRGRLTAAEYFALSPEGETVVDVLRQFPLTLSIANPNQIQLISSSSDEETLDLEQFAETLPQDRSDFIQTLPERSEIRCFLDALNNLRILQAKPTFETALQCRRAVYHYIWNNGKERLQILRQWALVCYELSSSNADFHQEVALFLLQETAPGVRDVHKKRQQSSSDSRPYKPENEFMPARLKKQLQLAPMLLSIPRGAEQETIMSIVEKNQQILANYEKECNPTEETKLEAYLKNPPPPGKTLEYTQAQFDTDLCSYVMKRNSVPDKYAAYCWANADRLNLGESIRTLILQSSQYARLPNFLTELAGQINNGTVKLSELACLPNLSLADLQVPLVLTLVATAQTQPAPHRRHSLCSELR